LDLSAVFRLRKATLRLTPSFTAWLRRRFSRHFRIWFSTWFYICLTHWLIWWFY